jgi:hypothetical protein
MYVKLILLLYASNEVHGPATENLNLLEVMCTADMDLIYSPSIGDFG